MIDLQVLVFFSPRPEDHLRKTNAAGVAAAFVREFGESLVCPFPLVPPEWGAVPIKIGKKGNALGIHGLSMLQSGKGCQVTK